MGTNAPDLSGQPAPLGPPYPAFPGQIVRLRLKISPDEHRMPPGTLVLKFLTTLEPQPPSTLQPPVKGVAPPDAPSWVPAHLEAGYEITLSGYESQVQAERTAWQQAHPQRSFQINATVKCDERGILELSGAIPDPSATEFQAYQKWDEDALYAGIYSLQAPQFFQLFPNEAPVSLDPDSAKAVAAYQLKFDKDYFHRTPPPPKTETITGLVIEPPQTVEQQS